MKTFFAFLFLLISFESVLSTPVRSCTGIPAPLNVDIEGCTTPPCLLAQGSDASMDITFRTPSSSRALSPKVWATVGAITTPYPLDSDGCKNLINGRCPITADETLLFNLKMPISSIYPQVSVDLEFRLVGDNNADLTCFKVAARVVGSV